jgi:hypothetical protein
MSLLYMEDIISYLHLQRGLVRGDIGTRGASPFFPYSPLNASEMADKVARNA